LGCGNLVNRNTPVIVIKTNIPSDIISVAAGGYHMIALTSQGKLYAWGHNSQGQLGNNDTSGTNQVIPVPVNMTGALLGKIVTTMTAGGNFSIALTSDGGLYSWGVNNAGELGNGDTTNRYNPTLVSYRNIINQTVIALSAGYGHTIALSGCASGYTGPSCNIFICYGKFYSVYY
jgi:alpha-tubulin suppressor-like RCC1 family protein